MMFIDCIMTTVLCIACCLDIVTSIFFVRIKLNMGQICVPSFMKVGLSETVSAQLKFCVSTY